MAARVKVGVLNDMCDGPPIIGDITPWLEREVAAVQASGRLDAEVEFVHAYGHGLPTGTAEAVTRAFMELARQDDIVMIAGPAIGDNALIATPLVEREQNPDDKLGRSRARTRRIYVPPSGWQPRGRIAGHGAASAGDWRKATWRRL